METPHNPQRPTTNTKKEETWKLHTTHRGQQQIQRKKKHGNPHTPISDGLSKQRIGKIQFAYDGIVTGYQSKIG
jgi:hypothetical protein